MENNIEMQLAEVELLQSMYPDQDELHLYDLTVLEDFRCWLDHHPDDEKSEIPRTKISFLLKIKILEDPTQKNIIEMNVTFPSDYPGDKCAEIFLTAADCLKRQDQADLNCDFKAWLEQTFVPDMLMMTEAVSWIQDHLADYLKVTLVDKESSSPCKKKSPSVITAGRLWLYSHHIYR
jgi:hypothetical protein